MRTTIDIDDPILRQLKKISRDRKASLGRVVSDLLARALEAEEQPTPVELDFVVAEMRPRYDLDDREALLDAMDGGEGSGGRSEHPKPSEGSSSEHPKRSTGSPSEHPKRDDGCAK